MRDALRLFGGDEVELTLEEDRVVLVPAPRKVKLRRSPNGILTSDLKLPIPITPEQVREELERSRR